MPADWKRLASELVAENGIFRLRRDRVVHPATSFELDAYVLECSDWINVIPLTPEGRVVMVRQFRHGVRAVTLEIPGGTVDPGEEPVQTAIRELREETGYAAEEVFPIGVVDAQPAFQNNRLHTFLALGAVRMAEPEPDEAEDIEVITVPLDEVPGLMRSGAISHSLVLTAFQWLHLWGEQPE